jgi:phosphosulfolactate synthase
MNIAGLVLPERTQKPRSHGLTIVLDNGVPPQYFADMIAGTSRLVDLVKFGWGTALVTDQLESKIASLRRAGLDFFFGGTLFEKFYSQRKVDAYYDFCRHHRCRFVEISNGTVDLPNRDKAGFIRDFAAEFRVLSEVGYKDTERSQNLPPAKWIEYMREDLAAGATKVITEARESGTSGICRADGEVRYGLIEEIMASRLPVDDLVFEAPNKQLQVYFIKRVGANVNLANIALADPIPLETLRLGLRSDTLLLADAPN